VTRSDIQIATYQDAIALVEAVAQGYGPLPQTACRSIVRELRERIDATLDRECHRKAAEALAS
jgi:hypothetical protein